MAMVLGLTEVGHVDADVDDSIHVFMVWKDNQGFLCRRCSEGCGVPTSDLVGKEGLNRADVAEIKGELSVWVDCFQERGCHVSADAVEKLRRKLNGQQLTL